jgi:hypothetical protein
MSTETPPALPAPVVGRQLALPLPPQAGPTSWVPPLADRPRREIRQSICNMARTGEAKHSATPYSAEGRRTRHLKGRRWGATAS